MKTKNKTPTEIFKYDIIELRRSILDMKEKKILKDVDILRYVYKNLEWILRKEY